MLIVCNIFRETNSTSMCEVIIFSSKSFLGHLSAEDPVHSLVYSAHAKPLSQPAAMVFRLYALWRRYTGSVETCGGH